MLFNSYEFIFLFLPITLALYFLSYKLKFVRAPVVILVLASLFFYAWWNPVYLILIIISIVTNFLIGDALTRIKNERQLSKIILLIGIVFNLSILAYFKYAVFFANNLNYLFNSTLHLDDIILPLAISFFTFQQIAFLVDSYRCETKDLDFLNYCLFVSFFPQLIAGPIVHHKEMMPQFAKHRNFSPRAINFSVGLTIFGLGLFKKVVIADGIALYATPVFSAAYDGTVIHFFQAWQGSLAYTFQLYFDFSGYSDMAIGIARLFGIRLPINFNSPYQATSISDFWRRWHITLSRFLRDYLYIALGGNRQGTLRRNVNLITTMLLGGLWHGAGWTFVIWGGLHGVYLVINHAWTFFYNRYLYFLPDMGLAGIFAARTITFLAVVIGWVFFRAESLDASYIILKGMIGMNGIELPIAIEYRLPQFLNDFLHNMGISFYNGGGKEFISAWLYILVLSIIVFFLPNTLRIMRRYRPVISQYGKLEKSFLTFRLKAGWAILSSTVLVISILALTRASEFLYFQF